MAAPTLAYWVHSLDPFLVRFSDSFGIRWYGVAYICAFVVAAWLLTRYARASRSLVPAAKVPDFLTALVLGVVLGGRIGHYLLYDGWRSFSSDPLGILRVWEGGMSFHGGLLGVTVAVFVYARLQRHSFLHLGDLVASVAPFGLFFGRLANFINGELWGKVSTVSWAVIFPQSVPPGVPLSHVAPRHPSQLYEAFAEGLLLTAFVQWRFWRTGVAAARPGRLAGECILAYAAARIFCEFFREPDASLIGLAGVSFSRGTFYSFFLVLGGLILVVISSRSTPLAPVRPAGAAGTASPRPPEGGS